MQAILAKAKEVENDPLRFSEYADYPVEFVRDVIGLTRGKLPEEFFPENCSLWTKQQELLRAFVKSPRVACKSGHGTGKSFDMGLLIVWWHLARRGRVVSTGPTKTHIADVLWPELHDVFRRSLVKLPGRLDSLHWAQDNYWYATGVTTDQPGAFHGRHHPALLVVIDEGAAVDDNIHLEADTCASGEGNALGMVGNPTLTSGRFYDAFKNPDTWKCLTISCLDHPNVVTGRNLIPGAISKSQVEKWRREWGSDHPYWYSRVLGEFPPFSEKGVIPLAWVERAKNKELWQKALKEAEAERLPRWAGMDVAGSGLAKCVYTVRRGDAVEAIVSWSHTNTMETANRVIQLSREYGVKGVAMDADGMGIGPVDRILEIGPSFELLAFHAGARAARNNVYSNRRAELWFNLRYRLEKQRIWLDPQHPELDILVADLVAPQWGPSAGGRTKVESKKELATRGVKSTDYADSLMMSYAFEPDPEAELTKPQWSAGQDPDPMLFVDPEEMSAFAQFPDGF